MVDLDGALAAGEPEHLVETARAVAAAVDHHRPDLDAALKWGTHTYALDGDFHHWLCAIGITERVVTLTFHFGALLDDPGLRLIAGASNLLRRLEYSNPSDVDTEIIAGFLDQAIAKYPYFKEHWEELRHE